MFRLELTWLFYIIKLLSIYRPCHLIVADNANESFNRTHEETVPVLSNVNSEGLFLCIFLQIRLFHSQKY